MIQNITGNETVSYNQSSVSAQATPKNDNYQPINCDQVAWLLNALDRVIPPSAHPRVSRHREMAKYACLYEIMEVAQLKFLDSSARWNGTPKDARDYKQSNP